MPDQLYWTESSWPGRLAVSPRPRGHDWLEDDIVAWRKLGVDIVVSLLMPDEARDLGLENEAASCESAGIIFHSFPIVDLRIPTSQNEVLQKVKELESALSAGKNVVVHCRQGIGRSGLLAAAVLIRLDTTSEQAVRLVSEARTIEVPETQEQKDWLRSFAASKQQLKSCARLIKLA
jgi:protein-tyrosine phosphatase